MPTEVCNVGVHLCLLSLLATGCYQAHGRRDPGALPDARPIPTRDAGTFPDRRPPPPPVDAGPVGDCAPHTVRQTVRAHRTCIPTPRGTIPPDLAFFLPVSVDGCFCEDTAGCRARISAPGTLALETWTCTDPSIDCDGCAVAPDGTMSMVARCEVPPLSAGLWRVEAAGSYAFELEVGPPDPISVSREVCRSFAAPDERPDGAVCPDRGPGSVEGVMACHALVGTAGRAIAIDLVDPCQPCCELPGTCTVTLEVDTLTIATDRRRCVCPSDGLCDPALCPSVTRTCHTPPLPVGMYRTVLDGAAGPRIVVRPPASTSPETCWSPTLDG